jgi:hypothetical protein
MRDERGDLATRILAALTTETYDVIVEPPGNGDGFWAGGPSAAVADGTIWLAYRLRRPVDQGRGFANVVARSTDGVHFDTLTAVTSEQFGSASLERPAVVPLPDGGLRVYVSCSTLGSKHWWVETVDLPSGDRHRVLPGDAATAWKDVVVQRGRGGWRMWACRHPLADGDDEADRMTTWYATSGDGLSWDLKAAALSPQPGTWDARGTRIASVLRTGDDAWLAFYDGRASAAENWHERTGVAHGTRPDGFTATGAPTPAGTTVRYLSVVELAHGCRLYWEASRVDGAHELRSAYVPRSVSATQS